jgi:hypothetical protein
MLAASSRRFTIPQPWSSECPPRRGPSLVRERLQVGDELGELRVPPAILRILELQAAGSRRGPQTDLGELRLVVRDARVLRVAFDQDLGLREPLVVRGDLVRERRPERVRASTSSFSSWIARG